jgi:hypothetical protein
MEDDLSGELDLLRGMEPIPPAPPVAVIGGWELVTVALEQASTPSRDIGTSMAAVSPSYRGSTGSGFN